MVSKLRIAIIECDNPAFSSINRRGNYGGIFSALLKAAAPQAGLKEEQLQFSVHNVVENTTDYPKLEDVDGVLLTGSSRLTSPFLPLSLLHLRSLCYPSIRDIPAVTQNLIAICRCRLTRLLGRIQLL